MNLESALCQAVSCCAVPRCAAAGGPSTRLATVAFGAGFGAGSAWQACAQDVSVPGTDLKLVKGFCWRSIASTWLTSVLLFT